MPLDLSLIRAIGLVCGIILIGLNFVYHRGPRWSRSAFGLLLLVGLALIVVSVWPDSVNGLRDMLNLREFAYGRLLTLAIVGSFGAILLALYTRARTDQLRRLVDRFICAETADRAVDSEAFAGGLKPITILIPALNEANSFELLLPRIPDEIGGLKVGVVVIDDGSTDGTGDVASRYGCLVARNRMSRGQGAALRVGYAILKRGHAEFAVTMDGDNQHRPEDLPVMLAPLLNGTADFVLGSRVLGSAQAGSAVRSIGITVLSKLISVLSGQRITDCSSGFKAIRASSMAKLDLREDQFQNSEVILEAAKKGLRIVEVPIHIASRSHGVSRKGPNMRYGFFFVKTMMKTWWR